MSSDNTQQSSPNNSLTKVEATVVVDEVGKGQPNLALATEPLQPSLSDFLPTPTQARAIVYLNSRDWDCTIVEVAKAVGVSDPAVHQWFNRAGFMDWYLAEAGRHFKKHLPQVQRAAVKAALQQAGRQEKKFNPAAIRLALERFDPDYKPASRQEIDITVSFDDALANLERAAREG